MVGDGERRGGWWGPAVDLGGVEHGVHLRHQPSAVNVIAGADVSGAGGDPLDDVHRSFGSADLGVELGPLLVGRPPARWVVTLEVGEARGRCSRQTGDSGWR